MFDMKVREFFASYLNFGFMRDNISFAEKVYGVVFYPVITPILLIIIAIEWIVEKRRR